MTFDMLTSRSEMLRLNLLLIFVERKNRHRRNKVSSVNTLTNHFLRLLIFFLNAVFYSL